MAKTNNPSYEEVLADLRFMLEQSYIHPLKKDYDGIRRLCKKYGVSW